MLITKFDLYKGEWLDLVFSNRNKSYGAYELRRSYNTIMAKAMGIAFFAVIGFTASYSYYITKPAIVDMPTDKDEVKETIFDLKRIKQPEPEKKIIPPVQPKEAKPEAGPKVKTTVIPTKVKSDNDPTVVDPPTKEEIDNSAIGTQKQEGENTTDNAPVDTRPGTGGGGSASEGIPESNEPVAYSDLSSMPEPVGGAQAWSKFLNKHLRFPSVASEQGVSGKVYISFIIERDGKLSNIHIERGAGFGFDEESLRVLKMAPAWKPGMQNGRPVRVKYYIPINFQLPND